jgi:hypothetical protein
MIPRGRFNSQLATVETILKSLAVLEDRTMAPNKGLGAAHFRGMTYRQVYEECVKEFAYDFRLVDQSLLLFIANGRNANDGSLSFSYYECPVEVMTYRDFVAMQLGVSADDAEDELSDWGDEFRADYEQYVTSVESKRIVTPIRYDYSALAYREGVHPASHVHFGFANEIRVGTRRIMNPVAFVLFVLRQRYPRVWERVFTVRSGRTWCRNVRDNASEVDAAFWNDRDHLELALH